MAHEELTPTEFIYREFPIVKGRIDEDILNKFSGNELISLIEKYISEIGIGNKYKIEAQKKLCKKNNYPHFAPKSGYCYNCMKNIYTEITFKKASEELITGCPHCKYSYCE